MHVLRTTSTLPILCFIACASAPPVDGPTFESVRDRLAASPTRLLVSAPESSATITARRWTFDGWQDGSIDVTLDGGELVATADADGQLQLVSFGLTADPITIPEGVFGKPARLEDVRLALASKSLAMTTWNDGDDATATARLDLDLSWSIAIDDATVPLGTQHLAPIPADLVLSGSGDHVDATLVLHGSGVLWSWAGLLELTELELELVASTTE